ncbi:hypothetical protein [Azospirillum sp. Sh1]|uniref:hypothetical protein n=1 Tax=Azospirillum sp. Sh1 TaxID=2607285 RepID=UPI0011EFC032|nr:hypothetical protein [Azospirillum sp. Sh1]KAA0575231.1 hypothetical protein FZ029_15850 [Azospirillum sp. Sh1]
MVDERKSYFSMEYEPLRNVASYSDNDSQKNAHEELVDRLVDLVKLKMKHDFHKDSRTHIVYCQGVGRRGLKGFGDFPGEALKNFYVVLYNVVESASKNEVENWLGRLNSKIAEPERRLFLSKEYANKIENYNLSLCRKQVNRVEQVAQNLPSTKDFQGAVRYLLLAGLAILEEEIPCHNKNQMKVLIRSKSHLPRNEWGDCEERFVNTSFEMRCYDYTRLKIAANEVDVDVVDLCRYVLVRALDSHSKGSFCP